MIVDCVTKKHLLPVFEPALNHNYTVLVHKDDILVASNLYDQGRVYSPPDEMRLKSTHSFTSTSTEHIHPSRKIKIKNHKLNLLTVPNNAIRIRDLCYFPNNGALMNGK